MSSYFEERKWSQMCINVSLTDTKRATIEREVRLFFNTFRLTNNLKLTKLTVKLILTEHKMQFLNDVIY